MNIETLLAHLATLELPLAYRQWEKGEVPTLPYLLLYRDESVDFMADNHNYIEVNQMSLELYTEAKNFKLEEKINTLFKTLEIPYKIYEGNLESEEMYEVLYEFTI